jgi:hypothetical protein
MRLGRRGPHHRGVWQQHQNPEPLETDRDHYTCGEPGWEAVADFALDWALSPVPGALA